MIVREVHVFTIKHLMTSMVCIAMLLCVVVITVQVFSIGYEYEHISIIVFTHTKHMVIVYTPTK